MGHCKQRMLNRYKSSSEHEEIHHGLPSDDRALALDAFRDAIRHLGNREN